MKTNKINTQDKILKENQSGFQMPDNYLNDFELRMLSRIEEESVIKKGRVIRFKSVLLSLIPAAAVLILGYFLLINNSTQTDTEIITNELSWDEYASFDETWIADELSELDQDQESDLDAEIDFLLEEGITTNEIIEIYQETP